MKYNGNNLKEVLEAHKKWLTLEDGEKADFAGTTLVFANLTGADLEGANFIGADLVGTDFTGANLVNADFRMADIRYSDLKGAKLVNADLKGANLGGADLRGADLTDVDLIGADLTDANFIGAKMPFVPMTCPDTGAFIAWKACASEHGKVIVKLLIPEDAKRSSSTGRKCRADKAVVLEIQSVDGKPFDDIIAWSMFDEKFEYCVGKTVVPVGPFCKYRFEECASGIHFFVNRQEAVDYSS